MLTIDATDPKSGTAEFKATAIRVEKLPVADAGGGACRRRRERRRRATANGDRATAANGDRRPVRESV